MPPEIAPDPVRQQALAALAAALVDQGHPIEYAGHMAAATIFQADLDLRNAQLVRLIAWLKQNHPAAHAGALAVLDATRVEFEQRIRLG